MQAERLRLQTGDEGGIAKANVNCPNTLSFIEGIDWEKSLAEATQRHELGLRILRRTAPNVSILQCKKLAG
jgi:hypothetical protein